MQMLNMQMLSNGWPPVKSFALYFRKWSVLDDTDPTTPFKLHEIDVCTNLHRLIKCFAVRFLKVDIDVDVNLT